MNRKQMVVANVQFKKPTADDTKRQKGLLRYLTYRDGRYGPIRQQSGQERWHDLGLGSSIREIAARCEALQSQHVLAFTLVFNANPQLMAMVSLEQREAFTRELTEHALSSFFEARGLESGMEASYVLHHRESEDPEAPGLHDPHTHLILPGTVFDEGKGERVPLFFSRNKRENHIELLHQVTEQTMTHLMDLYVGPDWEQRFDALEAVRKQQRTVIEQEPHGTLTDNNGQAWGIWAGVRRTDEGRSAAGIYRYFPNDPKVVLDGYTADDVHVGFRPFKRDLTHDQAAQWAQHLQMSLTVEPEQTMETLGTLAEQHPNSPALPPPEPEPPRLTYSGPTLDL